MNETLKSIFERYSCRNFTDKPLTEEQLDIIADAALAAPSAMNRQPWHVIVVTDKSLINELDAEGMRVMSAYDDKSAYKSIMAGGGKLFYNAPCMIMVVSDGSRTAAMDCGILSQNVTLAAHSLGLGSVICAMANIPLSGPNGAEFKKRFMFPDGYDFGISILLGNAGNTKEAHKLDKAKVSFIR